tara:strand:+ start:210 stop:524 length:315 start_codon:yes stop_codon:yes gene_type:complete
MGKSMMKKYKILFLGQNYLLDNMKKLQKYGFYTYRYIEANSADEAISIAMKSIKEKIKKSIKNDNSDPPKLTVDEMEIVDSFGDLEKSGTGFSFYPEDKAQSNE